ncbi:YuzB family protein [Paenibacillus sp. SC116]|uniref:YuzB family protein n=1 Tax=Paenibacillus sp. SC116 TaxID=2968986 RepID=UPI00215AB365|nr:YuzB family protein [Paenibacillus sp. SC116]MCR8842382.1 YuzB family protein [Paenibacillus sp. SC116]
MFGFVIVELCGSNQIHSAELEHFEQEHLDLPVLKMECLNRCGLCRSRPYALVNGKVVTARTISQCFEKVTKVISEINEEF